MIFSEREKQLLRGYMDKNEDGTIDYKEFLDHFDHPYNVYHKAVQPDMPPPPSAPRSSHSHRVMATPSYPAKSQRTTKGEEEKEREVLVRKIRQKLAAGNKRLQRIFNHIDDNGDGFLTASELQKGLKGMGFELNDQELHFLVDFVDSGGLHGGGGGGGGRREENSTRKGDSVITYMEFLHAFEEPDFAPDYDPLGKSRRREVEHFRKNMLPILTRKEEPREDSGRQDESNEQQGVFSSREGGAGAGAGAGGSRGSTRGR
eukprot:350944-Hanusia_phi.AAC.1